MRHMAHDTIPTGPPVRTPPHRLSGTDAQWIEDQIIKEVRRGQLERGMSEWGSPPFPTKASVPAHQRLRKRRMVVDYRRVNARTRRALYYVRRADDIKVAAAGSMWYTFLDACAGFNQIANTDRARRMLAILARSGQYLPRCLTFGPHNGPEDFSYAVDRLFSPGLHSQRRFCKEWLAYADDLTVRTSRYVDGQALTDEACSRYDARSLPRASLWPCAIPVRHRQRRTFETLSRKQDFSRPGFRCRSFDVHSSEARGARAPRRHLYPITAILTVRSAHAAWRWE